MKKIFSVILVLALVFCFSGCKKKNNSSDISSTPSIDTQDTSSQQVSSVETVVSSNTQSSSTASSKNNSSTASNSQPEMPKEVYPEKVVNVYSFKNQFVMPQVEKKTFYDSQNKVSLPYRLFMPHDYTPANKYPVILFLHGAGEIGNDNEDQLSGINKLFRNNGDLVASAFLICPQSYEWWNLDSHTQSGKGTLSSALRLLDEVTRTYSCDSNRIYVTGLSMGGYATWDLLENYGHKFAAGIPVCGAGNNLNGSAFVDIPIRIYHGTKDPTVPFEASQRMYNAITSAGGQKVELFPLEGVNHNAWDPTYSDRDAISWLLAQNKQTNPTCEYEAIPYFRITNSNGITIVSDKDVHALSYANDYDVSGIRSVDFILSSGAVSKLNRAYKMSGGSQFTFWCGTQKVYTFTATKELPDNVFSVRGIFGKVDYQIFYDTIEGIVYG